MRQARLLIVWHGRTGSSESLAAAALEGGGTNARMLRARDAGPQDFCEAQGYLFICPENLATMSGEMKEMFDRCYYALLGKIEGRAFATIIAAGSDGSGAQVQIDRIVRGWRLRRVADPFIVLTSAQREKEILARKTIAPNDLVRAREMGAALGQGLAEGIF